MKKTILILTDYLSHFWFTIFLLMSGFLSFSYSHYFLVNYSDLGLLGFTTSIFSGFFLYFLLPLSVLSVILFLFVWLKNKNKQGLFFLLLSIITPCFNFFIISRMLVISGDVRINQQLLESSVIMKNYQMDRLK